MSRQTSGLKHWIELNSLLAWAHSAIFDLTEWLCRIFNGENRQIFSLDEMNSVKKSKLSNNDLVKPNGRLLMWSMFEIPKDKPFELSRGLPFKMSFSDSADTRSIPGVAQSKMFFFASNSLAWKKVHSKW